MERRIMQPVTKEQESTLLRWAFYIGRRPGDSAKAFLRAENGLTGEQIDFWWRNSMEKVNRGGKFGRELRSSQAEESGFDTVQDSEPTLQSFEPSVYQSPIAFPQQSDQWSLLSSPVAFQAQTEQPQSWQQHSRQTSHHSSHGGHYSVSSNGTGVSSFSSLHFPGSENSTSTRSSALSQSSLSSKMAGMNTYSTFNDANFELFGSDPVDTINEALWSIIDDELPQDRRSKEHDLSLSHSCEPSSPQRELSASKPQHKRQRSGHPLDTPMTQRATSKPTVRYACTACKRPFSKRYEWKRHEGSSCEPQTDWICMHGRPDIKTSNGWMCAFCDASAPDHDAVKGHLEHNHHISKCVTKNIIHRTINRKDKFRDHLKNIHNLSDDTSHWETWEHKKTGKFAWGCGFCGACLYSWDARLKHIDIEHYETEGRGIEDWSSDLVIKGLLSQDSASGFDIKSEWGRLVSRRVAGTLGWSDDHIDDLKEKLQFRIGDPAVLAAEIMQAAIVVRDEGLKRDEFWEKPLPLTPAEQGDSAVHEVVEEGIDSMVFDTLKPNADIRMHD